MGGTGTHRLAGASVALLLVVAYTIAAAHGAVAAPRCQGKAATIVGTGADDELVGTAGADVIVSRAGADTVIGRGGNDRICSGPDPDVVRGGSGKDRIAGGGDTDQLFGGGGNDRLLGGAGSFDGLNGGSGDDLLDGGGGQDIAQFFDSPGPVEADLETGTATGHGVDSLENIEGFFGSNFDDVLLGDGVPNILVGLDGSDVIDGRGSGTLEAQEPDVIDGGAGDDDLDGGDGDDIVLFEDAPMAVTVDLDQGTAEGYGSDQLVDFEGAFGSAFGDTLIGDAGNNAFIGGAGDDVIDGAGGIDRMGFFDSPGPVVVDLATGTATGFGTDTLVSIEGVEGSAFADVISGDGNSNSFNGGTGDDTLSGAGGDDILLGDDGVDSADGGTGSDACDAETEVACES